MKKLALVSLVVFSLLLFGCIKVKEKGIAPPVFGNSEPEAKPPQAKPPGIKEAVPPCFDILNLQARDSCLSLLAKNTANESVCGLVYGEQEREKCVYPFVNMSLSACEKTRAVGVKDSCLELHAKSNKDEELCSGISDGKKRDACVSAIVPPCSNKSFDMFQKGRCLAWQMKDYSQCGDGGCLLDYAIEFKEIGACTNISEEANRLACESMFSSEPACSKATRIQIADSCYQIVAEYRNESYYCGLATEKSSYKNDCYKNMAASQRDISVCGYSDTTILEDDCYLNYAKVARNAPTCGKIFSGTKKDTCYRGVALEYGYMSYCNDISTSYGRNLCFSAVAFGNGGKQVDAQGCMGIIVEEWKNKCYTYAATSANDKEICSLITENDGAKKSCLGKFGS